VSCSLDPRASSDSTTRTRLPGFAPLPALDYLVSTIAKSITDLSSAGAVDAFPAVRRATQR
jgi:hypothetical protein